MRAPVTSPEVDPGIPDDPSDAPAPGEEGKPRRALLKYALAGAVTLAGGSALTVFITRKQKRDDAAEGALLAQRAYAALRDGEIARAVDLAHKARTLDPDGRDPAHAWLHAVGMDLMEGSGDAQLAVGFVNEARKLGARQTELAFATLAAAVAMKNDNFARRLLDQHEEQRVRGDAFYDFAAGAALDLDCDALAEERFRSSAAQWVDAALPRLRRARALAFAGRYAEARADLGAMAKLDSARVLAEVTDRLESPRPEPAYVDLSKIVDFPRSIRALAQALMLSSDNPQLAIDAALGDIDSPLVAAACATIALRAGDLASAERAAEVAREMRSEMPQAAALLVRLKLLRGDLAAAKVLVLSFGEADLTALVAGIVAYEARKLEQLESVATLSTDLHAWSLTVHALGLLGKGPRPSIDALKKAMEAKEPWADMLLLDLALETDDAAVVDSVVKGWTDDSPPRAERRGRIRERAQGGKTP